MSLLSAHTAAAPQGEHDATQRGGENREAQRIVQCSYEWKAQQETPTADVGNAGARHHDTHMLHGNTHRAE
jgi:hypothetical protein